MPNYGVAQVGGTVTAVYPGDTYVLFNAETPTAPQASVAFNRAPSGWESPGGIIFTISFANTTPTARVDIEGSNVDSDAQYQSLAQIINLQNGYYSDAGTFAYYRAKLVSGSGGALTVIAQR
jgi:hypothetical protein